SVEPDHVLQNFMGIIREYDRAIFLYPFNSIQSGWFFIDFNRLFSRDAFRQREFCTFFTEQDRITARQSLWGRRMREYRCRAEKRVHILDCGARRGCREIRARWIELDGFIHQFICVELISHISAVHGYLEIVRPFPVSCLPRVYPPQMMRYKMYVDQVHWYI